MENHLSSLCNVLFFSTAIEESTKVLLQKAAQWALSDNSFQLSQILPYQPTALKPVLATLKGNITNKYIPAELLTLEKGKMMPVETEPSSEKLIGQIEQLKDKLQLDKSETELLTLLEIYTSTLAVSKDYQDLVLFDFIKTTVGIARCLDFEKNQSKKLRLAGGTISGIQTYLYEIVSKNAAKLLKGRSFYVQLLADSLLEELLKQLFKDDSFELSSCNVIYASGGGFFVLIPDTPDIESTFKSFATKASEKIYAVHKTSLFTELAITEPFEFADEIDEVWKDIYKRLDALKYKRLNQHDLIWNDFFNDAIEVGGVKERDPITNEELVGTTRRRYGIKMLETTSQQLDLGKNLRNTTYWVTSKINKDTKDIFIDPFSTCHYLVNDWKKAPKDSIIYKFNDIDASHPFTFYGGNKFPTFSEEDISALDPNDPELHEVGDIKPFEYLVGNDPLKRLAILRMDVDGLGAIFSDEIGKAPYRLNFTRYATTSRSLDYFFKGYLNTLQKPYEHTSIIIYSGGDDLFIVGKWSDVLQLAQRIQEEFSKWSCHNLTLSGGIVLLPSKFPIMQGARLAEDAEKKAKKHILPNGDEKNAICLFDKSLNWESEFTIVHELFKKILNLINNRALNKSFLDKINSHASAEQFYSLAKNAGKSVSPKWQWVMAYDMTRYRNTLKVEEAKDFIDLISKNAFLNMYNGQKLNSNYSFLELLQIATRWVELQYRTDKPEEFAD